MYDLLIMIYFLYLLLSRRYVYLSSPNTHHRLLIVCTWCFHLRLARCLPILSILTILRQSLTTTNLEPAPTIYHPAPTIVVLGLRNLWFVVQHTIYNANLLATNSQLVPVSWRLATHRNIMPIICWHLATTYHRFYASLLLPTTYNTLPSTHHLPSLNLLLPTACWVPDVFFGLIFRLPPAIAHD